MNLKEMLESINSGYSLACLPDIEIMRINHAHENVNEYAFYIPADSNINFCEEIGTRIKCLEFLALHERNVESLIFDGEILDIVNLFSLHGCGKKYDDLEKLFSENVMLIRTPIELFFDKDNKIVLYFSFGYVNKNKLAHAL